MVSELFFGTPDVAFAFQQRADDGLNITAAKYACDRVSSVALETTIMKMTSLERHTDSGLSVLKARQRLQK